MNTQTHHSNTRHSIIIGFFTVLTAVLFGSAIAFTTGLLTPSQAFAQLAPPCCTFIPTPPPAPPIISIPTPIRPPKCTLSVAPTSIQTGASSKLTWHTSVASTVSIDNGIGSVGKDGTREVSPTKDATYTLTATGSGGKAVCRAAITVTPPPAPTCTLSASPASITKGDSSKLTWTTTHATSFTIDHYVWSVVHVSAGNTSVSPATTTTYTGTAKGAGGKVTCHATVKVVPLPTCTLSASPASITKGDSSKLTWTTTHATSFTIDHYVWSVVHVSAGNTSVSPATTTTYTGTAKNVIGKTVTCHATVKVVPPVTPPTPPAPTCTLSASPTSISSGKTSKLTWTTKNTVSFVINHNIGTSTPVAAGSTTTPSLSSNVTYTAVATSADGKTATCHAVVTVGGGGGGGGGPLCLLTVSPTAITRGHSATLSWGGYRIASVFINNSIGTTTSTSGSKSVSPGVGKHTYTGTFTSLGGVQKLKCSATLNVTGGGGGGGGGELPPIITLTTLHKPPSPQPLAFVYLSQIPYTGLSLGPVGTIFYWLVLALFSIAVAYFVLFIFFPKFNHRIRAFGRRTREVLNEHTSDDINEQPMPAATAGVQTPIVPAPPEEDAYEMYDAPEASRGYSQYEGLRSLASHGALTIDDIVKGLSREPVAASTILEESNSTKRPIQDIISEQAMTHLTEQIKKSAPPASESVPTPTDSSQSEAPREMAIDTRGFLATLLEGDRSAVFAALRQVVRGGGSVEQLLTDATCALDDAYRARIDGTACDEDIARLSAKYATPVLEHVISALTTAIDSSYSNGMTGAKLALTRALSEIGA